MFFVPVWLLIHMGWFLYTDVFRSLGNKGIQEGYGTIFLGVFHGELDVWVLGVDMLEELMNMLCLLDDKYINYIPEP